MTEVRTSWERLPFSAALSMSCFPNRASGLRPLDGLAENIEEPFHTLTEHLTNGLLCLSA